MSVNFPVVDLRQPLPGMELSDELRAAVAISEQTIPGPDGAPDVRVLIYRPVDATGTLPLVLSYHGGGFGGSPDWFARVDAEYATLGAVVVAPDYRIAPAHVFPAAADDCYATLCWAVDTLDIDPARVVVAGTSAGGCLAAAITLMARDRRGPAIAFQALHIPVTDDRCRTRSMQQFVKGPIAGGERAPFMWAAYLGEGHDPTTTSPYAAPNRAESLAGLPPAFVMVGGYDQFRDEGVEYAMRLLADDVQVELYCAPRQHHGVTEDERTLAEGQRLLRAAIRNAIAPAA